MITLKELRPGLPEVINNIDKKLDRYIVSKRGKPVAVMMSIDEYEGLLETLDILSDKELMKRIEKGEKDIKAGRTISFEEARRRIEGV